MAYIEWLKQDTAKLKIMIFTEGTILKPRSLFLTYNHKSYIPIGTCVKMIDAWHDQGAEIVYCTSRRGKHAISIAAILTLYGFSGTRLYYRAKGQKYKDIVEQAQPDVLIEDDCKSIGGRWQMCITYVNPESRMKIKSIVVNEFKGIDHLPQALSDL
ncbi:MAG: hypothetical protein LBU67_01090 [Oscillospiraceae bacterium]|nr:hypothetical protein [Oscillospiraceae bacterium]